MNKGDRIRLIKSDDPWTKLKCGDEGTVRRITDDTISVKWDSGSNLSLLIGEDFWEEL
ncbi:MAG: DUF4314 domain-containing protein [Euryarchaeota archaeon]|nr:DUF4314 domain-containing protein [Euryarchaeota archaeon]MBM88966.1 DUF4314 domain-containing protein [Gammaproteobacteria bacterium]|tara:strand:+ start:1065 stop:1238 length:174 start_codon:yes stop_codon:yes gene_type:complete